MVMMKQPGVAAPLFRGRLICLAAYDMEKDPAVEARWYANIDTLHLFSVDTPRPLAAYQLAKLRKDQAKDEGKSRFTFSIRAVSDDRLLGLARLWFVDFPHGDVWFDMGIGLPEDRGHGCGQEALDLLMLFIFEELNLRQVIVRVGEYNVVGLAFLEKNGFERQACWRQSIHRAGQLWDTHILVLTADEWQKRHPQESEEA